MANYELITFNPTSQHRQIQQSNQITLDLAAANITSPPTGPNSVVTKGYVDSVVFEGAVTSIENAGTGPGTIFISLVSGVASLRNLKAGSGVSISLDGSDNIIISAQSTPYFFDFTTGEISVYINVGGTYNLGTNQLEAWRNGLRLFNSNSIGGPTDQYSEYNNNNIQLAQTAVATDWFGFLNYSASVLYSTLITSVTGTGLTVPTYTLGNDSFRIYRNGVLLNHSALGSPVDQYSEVSTTSVSLGLAAVATDVFLVESVPIPSWRQDITGLSSTTVNFTNPYALGNNSLIGFRNGLLMANTGAVGSPVDQYTETNSTSVTLSLAAVATDVFTFISIADVPVGTFANPALSNLTATSINQSLTPYVTNGSLALGSQTNYWGPSFISQLNDASNLLAIQVFSRYLVAPNGLAALDWSVNGILNARTNQISNVVDPTHAQDAATKHYVDNFASGANTALSNLVTTSINESLIPASAGSQVLGSSADYWGPSFISQLDDISGNASINPFTRRLYWTDGLTIMLDWSAGGILNASTNQISNVVDPTHAQDAATKHYVDSSVTGANTALSNLVTTSINESLTPNVDLSLDLGTSVKRWLVAYVETINAGTAALSLVGNGITANSNQIHNVVDPTSAQDAATKHYVDTAAGSGANTALSNLVTTSINESLIPASAGSQVLGSAANYWGPSFISQLDDSSSKLSIDVFNRLLYWTDGTTPMFSWAAAGILNAETNQISNLVDPTNAQDAATKNYVDTHTNGANTSLSNLITTSINESLIPASAGSQVLGSAADYWGPSFVSEFIDTSSKLSINVFTRTLYWTDGTTPMFSWATAGTLNAETNLISNVVDPTSAQDAATKNYVDTAIAALTFANTALSNLTTTSINQSLIPASAGSQVLGTATDYWGTSFISKIDDTSSKLSIDIFNRKLYYTDGTTVQLDWSGNGHIVTQSILSATGNTYTLGNAANAWTDIYSNTYTVTDGANFYANLGLNGSTPSGNNTKANLSFPASTGPAGIWTSSQSGSSESLYVETGNAAAGNSGSLIFNIGTATGTRGHLEFRDGSQGTAGYVWTSIDAQGSGTWDALPASANPALSNLTTTSINQSLIPASAGSQVLGTAADYWGPSFISQLDDASSELSIDVFNRKLYWTDGATVMVDWSGNGVKLGPSSGSTAIHSINGGVYHTTNTVAASTYTVDSITTDYLIGLNSASNTIAVTMPAPITGRTLILQDLGNAGTNNITFLPHAAELLNGQSSFVMAINYAQLIAFVIGGNWYFNTNVVSGGSP